MVKNSDLPLGIICGVYSDPFIWSIVKSFTVFFVGVWLARQCKGMELMPSEPPISNLNL
ncbi:uncharacterized protein [Anabrus simplex]|uniref:uncharacterized protein n=1 Tax=Anabrus simplex TaxID=316456 RepID=UPI0035A2780A